MNGDGDGGAAAQRAVLAPVDLLPLDAGSCFLPTTRPNILICEPYAQLIFKSDADRRAAAPTIEGKPPAVAFAPSACSRPVRLDVPLHPLIRKLPRGGLASATIAFDIEIAGPRAERRWEWAAILAPAPDGGQAFRVRIPPPPPPEGEGWETVRLEAILDPDALRDPRLSFAIQYAAGSGRILLRRLVAAITDAWFGAAPPAGKVAPALPPTGTVTIHPVVPGRPASAGEDAVAVALPASAEELRRLLDAPGLGGADTLHALIRDGDRPVRAVTLRPDRLEPFLRSLRPGAAARSSTVAERIARAAGETAHGSFLAALAEIDAIPDAGPADLQVASHRMIILLGLRRFDEAIDVYERGTANFRRHPMARQRYVEACASAGRLEPARRLLREVLAEDGPGTVASLSALYRFASLLDREERAAMAGRLMASADRADAGLQALVRVAHDRAGEGDSVAAERVLAVVAARSTSVRERAAAALLKAQIAFVAGRYAAQAEAFNEALALHGVAPMALRDVGVPFIVTNVAADGGAPVAAGPLVSIVMTTFNSAGTVADAVGSVLAQTYRNIEVIVVDDASSDDTMARLAAMAERDPRLRVERMPRNAGTYIAKNAGIARAKGVYLTCQDADDWAHPQKIAVMVARLSGSEGLVATGVQHVRASRQRGFQCRGNNYVRPDASSLMLRRAPVLERAGYFDSVRSGADSEFLRRIERIFDRSAVAYGNEILSLVNWSATTLSGGGAFAIDDDTGIMTPLRNSYRRAYTVWHETSANLRIDFPLERRPFPVPEGMTRPPAGGG